MTPLKSADGCLAPEVLLLLFLSSIPVSLFRRPPSLPALISPSEGLWQKKGNLTLGMGQTWRSQTTCSAFNRKHCVIVLYTCARTLRAFCPNDLKLTLCQLNHITVDNKETGGRDRENYGGTYYNKSTTCWLFVQVEGERKRGGGVKGGSRGPQLMGGVICES